ncbi:MAG: sodium:solute symporter family protein [Pirellulaceae bacterium]
MIPLIIVAVYLCLLLILGVCANQMFRGSSKDYMLASHSIGPFLLLMSLFGTTMTAFALVGSTGEAYAEGVGVYGLLASSSGIIHSLCFFVLGIKLWTLGKKYGYVTQIQYFRDRLESDKIGVLLFPILVSLVIPYLLIGVMAGGTVINGVSEGAFATAFAQYDYGLPPWLGSLIISVVVLIYVFIGGMRGTAWANAFQTMVFMVLGVVTFFIISDKLGGLQAASQRVAEKNPTKLIRDRDPQDIDEYEETLARWRSFAEYNYATEVLESLRLTDEQRQEAHSNFPARMPSWQKFAETKYALDNNLQNLSFAEKNEAYLFQDDRQPPREKPDWWDQRVMTGHELNEYERTANPEDRAYGQYADKIGHPADLLDPENPEAGKKWTRKRATGVYRATNWSPEEPRRMPMVMFITYMFVPLSVGMFPHLFQHWLTAKSAGTFKLPVVAHPLFIAIVWVPCILVGVWATSADIGGRPLPPHFPPNAVLVKMVAEMTTPILTGLLTAGILAAIMSSLDSQFLCIGTIFTEDVVVHYGGKNRFSDKQIVIIARVFIVLIVAITYAFSLMESRRVFTLGVWCFSGFSALFPLILAALYWRGLTKAGAYACILSVVAMWSYMFYDSNFAGNPHYNVWGVHPSAVMVCGSAIVLVLVSLITKPPTDETLRRFFPEKEPPK